MAHKPYALPQMELSLTGKLLLMEILRARDMVETYLSKMVPKSLLEDFTQWAAPAHR